MNRIVIAAVAAGLLSACSGASATGTGGEAGAATSSTSGSASGGVGGGGGGSCPLYLVPAGTDLMSPTVTFKADVMHVFNANCGATSCHGTTMNPTGTLFLGTEAAAGSDASTVYAKLVGPKSVELTSMPYVTPGDPSKSYLMHKIDGDQCAFDPHCVGGTCLAVMPNGLGQPMPVATRDTVRRWIAQGAKDD